MCTKDRHRKNKSQTSPPQNLQCTQAATQQPTNAGLHPAQRSHTPVRNALRVPHKLALYGRDAPLLHGNRNCTHGTRFKFENRRSQFRHDIYCAVEAVSGPVVTHAGQGPVVGGPGDQCTGLEMRDALPFDQQLTKCLRDGYATLRATAAGSGKLPLPAPVLALEDPSRKYPHTALRPAEKIFPTRTLGLEPSLRARQRLTPTPSEFCP